MPCLRVLSVLGLCLGVMPAFAQITRSVDEQGRVTYSDKPAPGSAAKGAPAAGTVPAPARPPPQKPGTPLAVQPKYHVPGDPLVAKMHENEERRLRERIVAECWRERRADCTEEWVIREQVMAERRAQQQKAPKPAPVVREPLPPDFCQRNPRVEACQPHRPLPDVAQPPDKPAVPPAAEKPATARPGVRP
jgi:hypothetical protein